jgi:hypothetical protein
VRQWAKRGLLYPGCSGTWSWRNTSTGEHSGTIRFRIETDAAVLDYLLDGDPRQQRVLVLRTPCNYGGTRPWFACPHCRARVAVLFMRRGGFYCRNCADVAYCSQSEDAIGRAWRMQRKAEARLGQDLERPKGMHGKTYERLLEAIFRSERVREAELVIAMARLGIAL